MKVVFLTIAAALITLAGLGLLTLVYLLGSFLGAFVGLLISL